MTTKKTIHIGTRCVLGGSVATVVGIGAETNAYGPSAIIMCPDYFEGVVKIPTNELYAEER